MYMKFYGIQFLSNGPFWLYQWQMQSIADKYWAQEDKLFDLVARDYGLDRGRLTRAAMGLPKIDTASCKLSWPQQSVSDEKLELDLRKKKLLGYA